MSTEQHTPCIHYGYNIQDGRKTGCCLAGHVRIHPVCRGVVSDMYSPIPMCMLDDIEPRLLQEDGMPLGWKAFVKGEE